MKTRLCLGAPRLRPAYEEVFQDIFAIHRGERLFANLAMQGQIAGARFRFRAHDLVACLAARADEIGGIVFDHTGLADMPVRVGIA